VSLGAGSHQIIAVYQGSRKFAPSTSGPLNQLVQKASTTATLASSKNPMLLRHAVTYTVTVNGRYGGPVSGTVTFRDGGTTVATETLLDDQATYRTAYPLAGMHTITAIYSGDANNGGSGTASLIQAIKAATTTVVTTSGSPSLTGHAVTFTATVSSTYGPIPDGEPVAFYNNGNVSPMGTGTTVNSTASFTTNALAAGTHVIKATYAGDATFHSSSGKVTEVVENP
jgi:hypothetical protein